MNLHWLGFGHYLFAAGVLIFAIAINYLLALAGEPRAVWLFHEVLGVM